MAKVGVWGPFESANMRGPLAPGEARWVNLGEHESLEAGAALSVTASPYSPNDTGTYVLKVDDVNVSCVVSHPGLALPERRFTAGCNVTNTGTVTVKEWRLLVGVIVPD